MPRTRTLTLDLHVHTNYSHDGRASVEEVVESAIMKKLDGIAICDHNTMEGSHAAQKYVADSGMDLIIIPGIEVSTAEGHLLLLGVKDEKGIEKGLPAEETIRRARQQEKDENSPVVIIAPHPFHPFRHSSGNFCTHTGVDAIEVFNSRSFTGIANEKARKTAVRNKSTTVSGSDAHSADCVGLATVVVAVDVNVNAAQKPECKAILRALKEGKVQLKDTKRTPFWLYLSQMCLKKR
ncbi:MAG: CehA/McbA family metallohydrolase [Methanomicrobia archaeon]|nr:CehA/McbA family metallohydrolase [Methanomicrobia archaeon]